MNGKIGVVVTCVAALIAFASGSAAAAPRYVAVLLQDDGRSFGADINAQGDTVGDVADLSVGYFGFLNAGGVTHILPDANFASGLNDLRQVVGSEDSSIGGRGFVWFQGEFRYIGPRHLPSAINSQGHATGRFFPPGSSDPRVLLYADGVVQDLGPGVGQGINDAGQITGQAYPPSPMAGHAFLFSSGGYVDLGIVGSGAKVNRLGHVVGTGLIPPNLGLNRAFLYADGAVRDLGTLGGDLSWGAGINDLDHVVGRAYTSGNAAQHAFLYMEGKMHDLNDLVVSGLGGRTAIDALAINDRGQIVGTACGEFDNTCRAFRFDPLPEPQPAVIVPTLSNAAFLATILLIVACAAWSRARRRSRRRRAASSTTPRTTTEASRGARAATRRR